MQGEVLKRFNLRFVCNENTLETAMHIIASYTAS